MQMIFLSGKNKDSNLEWIKQVKGIFSDLYDQGEILYYQHWKNGENNLSVEKEAMLLKSIIMEDEYIIFAKSAGVICTLYAIHNGLVHPSKCIFVGTAAAFAREANLPYEDYLKGYTIPTLFIQNTNDPVLSFLDLEHVLKTQGVEGYDLEELPSDTHTYQDIEKLRFLSESFLNKGYNSKY